MPHLDMENEASEPRPIKFHGAALKAMRDLPDGVRQAFQDGLFFVTMGEEPGMAKALEGFNGRKVLELRKNDRAGTYRAVYTVRFAERVYVLHCFQKKSHKGISTDKSDIELIKARLKWAEAEHIAWLKGLEDKS